MKTALLWTLIVVNALLVMSFVGQLVHENTARAQVPGLRRPGEYIMIDGTVNGTTAGVVYVVDTVNGQLTALTCTQSGAASQIQTMPPIDLASVFAQAPVPTRGGGR